jgi:hypothetical protein
MFSFMGCNDIFVNIQRMNNNKELGCYTKALWEEVDSSLTPVLINTLLVSAGMLITYYQIM